MLKLTLCLLALAAGVYVSTVAVMGAFGGNGGGNGGNEATAQPRHVVKCGCHYPRLYMPVCGSDNVTYDNSGVVRCVNICNETNITVQHKGVCTKA